MERMRLAGVPALVAHAGSPRDAAARGTVLLYHPLGRAKELHAAELELLAGAGFLAVAIDAIGHGERRLSDGWRRFVADPPRALAQVVRTTAAEVPALVDALAARGWAHPGRVGIAGVSLGGFVAYGAAAGDRRVAAAAAIAGSPRWGDDPASPHRRPERFHPVALLSVVAERDTLVPPGGARALHRALSPRYAATPERLRLVELAGELHWMADAAWARARDEARRWFERFLAGDAAAEDAPAP